MTVGEKEKEFVFECYNFCNGKKWSDVLVYAKSKLFAAGLPEHVVSLYLNCKNDRIITKMKNIAKNFVEERAAPANNDEQQMKYAGKKSRRRIHSFF